MSIESSDVFSFNYYTYNEPFTGSDRGMRYRISRKVSETEGEPDLFEACVWPEPYSEAATEDALKTTETFPFTEEGKEEVVVWLNHQRETGGW